MTLKAKNIPLILIYIIWTVSLAAVFISGLDEFWIKLSNYYKNFKIEDGILVGLGSLIVIVFTGLISAEWKARIVFLKWKNPLPGHRSFTKLAKLDSRIDLKILEKKYGTLPVDEKEQNLLWYKIYKEYENEVIVKTSQSHFLLTRDLASVTIIVTIIIIMVMLIYKLGIGVIFIFFLVMTLHYFVLILSSQNYGRRFVCNVLTLASLH